MLKYLLLLGLIPAAAQGGEPIRADSAANRTAVVELYTSEGCSSCPPADRWLSQLLEIPRDELDVLALAFHVDYWNYLGWKDRFSSKAYTARQRLLGANNAQRTIYTPEFFVDGKEARGTRNIIEMIQQSNRTEAEVRLELSVVRDGGSLLVDLRAAGEAGAEGRLHHRYLVYETNLATEVRRGENAGKTLEHVQVVRYLSKPYGLGADHRHRIDIDPEWDLSAAGVAVIATTPGSEQYLQAVHVPLAALAE